MNITLGLCCYWLGKATLKSYRGTFKEELNHAGRGRKPRSIYCIQQRTFYTHLEFSSLPLILVNSYLTCREIIQLLYSYYNHVQTLSNHLRSWHNGSAMNIRYESFDAGHYVKIEDFTFYKCTVLAQDYIFFLCKKFYI